MVNNLTKAQQADKDAADRIFRSEIRLLTVNELKGLAPAHVCQKLRSRDFLFDWKKELHRVIQLGGPLATLAQTRSAEVKTLLRKYNFELLEKSGISDLARQTFGVEPPNGVEMHGLTLWAVCEMFKQLRQQIKSIGKDS